MCLAVPGRVVSVHETDGQTMAQVDFGGLRKEVCLAYIPDVQAGEYVIVHVGFAISHVDEAEALRTLEILGEMGVMEPELMTMGPGMDAPAVVSDDAPGPLRVGTRL